ncbi:hypothetical protein BGZ73_007768 [Actinomortierella ambigua]|nr:hypothetical protein BGZ73_007768 [Actinomortierella ambigua]
MNSSSSTTIAGSHAPLSSVLAASAASGTSSTAAQSSSSSSSSSSATATAAAVTNNQWLFRKEEMQRTPSLFDGDIGATCVYLASKTEESTRKFKDVIITCAQRAAKKDTPIDDQSKEYRAWKETIMYMEEILLEVLCFDLSVEHPYALMLTLIDNHYTKDAHRARKLKQVSWAFINDSLRTTLCLVYPPKVVALAAIHLAGKYLDENLSECLGDVWRELYEPDVADITDAANEILEQYSQFGSRGSNNERGAYPGSKPGSEYQENGTPVYSGYLNSPAKLTTPVYNNVDREGRT